MSGSSGMGRMALVKQVLSKRALEDQVPPDLIYVNNFDDEDMPISIELKPGTGKELKKEMEDLNTTFKRGSASGFSTRRLYKRETAA